MSFYTGLGGWYSYRMSKAALNMATRNLSIELSRSRPKVTLEFLSNTYLSKKINKSVDPVFTNYMILMHCVNTVVENVYLFFFF